MDLVFEPWPKTPRLFDLKGVVVTEKIDGTNACVIIGEDGDIGAQSRNRLIFPTVDNYGFAAWVWDNRDGLAETLGPGRHYGEWWGRGIQRGYDLPERRFSLFNTEKWGHFAEEAPPVPGLGVVPVLYDGPFSTDAINGVSLDLVLNGSKVAPGYKRPEGVCVYHRAAARVFKVIIDK
ncbi:RNA ligase family protein [Nonomuraea sp. B19D2]|uniref:RNA ligase family protein n=1 Tax=Nonomuraea sp. B19D2 TaxID=3159561 RepID=UPI0032DB48A0